MAYQKEWEDIHVIYVIYCALPWKRNGKQSHISGDEGAKGRERYRE